ncbi:hypothetical protein K466DRAFT_652493 [Polyporus arcularius HHB13444]|uniref:DUF6534 domain-containing protein n=1 Tax=Polyporus arcularius HHB13444 TaxID=1314778 RepID=A0A5C3PG78_9APHY|nr:hypothetical protein K466DRAFT_652493 [Polyporus arcularius HHB13444]
MQPTVIHARDTSTTSPVAIAVGACLALILYGQVSQGAYQYFRRYPKDGYDLKAIIAGLIIFHTIHTVCVTHVCYASLVGASSHSGEALYSFVFSLGSFWVVGPSSGITLIIAHCFFARRVYKLGRQPVAFSILMAALSVLLIGMTTFYVIEVIDGNGLWLSKIEIIVVLGLSLLANIALTWRLVLHLRNSRTGFNSTDTLINRLIHFSVNTGLLTGVLTLASIVILVAWPANFAYYPVTAVLAPVHASVVLAALNSRRSLVDRGSEGLELRSFDLDMAPRLHRTGTTIQFTTPSGTILEGGEASAGASADVAQAVQVHFAPPEDEDVDVDAASIRKTDSVV